MGYISIQINKAKGSADTGASDHIERKMHEFVWQTKACTEIGNALSKKGVNVFYNVIPEGRHCEEDWEKECDTFLPFLVQ